MLKWMGLFLREKIHFRMLVLNFSSKLNWDSYIMSFAKTASKKTGTLISSMKFPSPNVVLCISINLSCTHAWNTSVTPGLVHLGIVR